MSTDVSSMNIPIEYIIARYMVKYNRLDEIIPKTFAGSKAETVNLYVDLYSMYHTIISRTYRTKISDYTGFASGIINLCSHYRTYFKKLGVYTNIFLISSYNLPDFSQRIVSGYNSIFVDKLSNTETRKMIENNVDILGVLCPYLPNIYLLKTAFESSVMIDHLINLESSHGNDNPNIILTSDMYPYQLSAEHENTVILYPVKAEGSDLSILNLPKSNPNANFEFWRSINRKRHYFASGVYGGYISARNYMLLEAMHSFPERGIKMKMALPKAYKLIWGMVGDAPIKLTLEMIYEKMPELYMEEPIDVLISRYRSLDVGYQSILFNDNIESKTLHYENLSDPDAIAEINNNFFKQNPIDILHL